MPDVSTVLSYRQAARIRLDPRTAFGALIVVDVICLGAGFAGPAIWARILASALPLVLLLAQKHWLAGTVCAAATALALVMETAGVAGLTGLAGGGFESFLRWFVLVVGAIANLIARVLPVVLMAWYVVATTRVGELMGAMARLHLPRPLVIALAVVLRMIPVFTTESAAIGQAARTRGLRVGLARPAALVNYRIVPLSLRAVDISDELSQAGLTRGLEVRRKRTCLGQIGFRLPDLVVLVWAVAALVLWFVEGR